MQGKAPTGVVQCRQVVRAAVFAASLLVGGCGLELTDILQGSLPPDADAGPDQAVVVGQAATLAGEGGSVSRPADLDFAWSFTTVPAGSGVSGAGLSGADTASPSFTPDVEGAYALELTVSYPSFDESTDTTVANAFLGTTALVGQITDSLAAWQGIASGATTEGTVGGGTYSYRILPIGFSFCDPGLTLPVTEYDPDPLPGWTFFGCENQVSGGFEVDGMEAAATFSFPAFFALAAVDWWNGPLDDDGNPHGGFQVGVTGSDGVLAGTFALVETEEGALALDALQALGFTHSPVVVENTNIDGSINPILGDLEAAAVAATEATLLSEGGDELEIAIALVPPFLPD